MKVRLGGEDNSFRENRIRVESAVDDKKILPYPSGDNVLVHPGQLQILKSHLRIYTKHSVSLFLALKVKYVICVCR